MRYSTTTAAVALLLGSVAPALAQTPNWTGFYLGVNGGYAFSENRTVALSEQNAAGNTVFRGNFGTLSPSGGFGGGQLGYNWHFPNNWVLGAELDAQGGDISDRAAGAITPHLGAGTTINVNTNSTVDWFTTFRARVGYAYGPWLPYVTFGGGAVRANNQINMTDAVLGTVANGSRSETRATFVGGGGLEYMFSPSWSGKLEYQFLDLSQSSVIVQERVAATGALNGSQVQTHPGAGIHTIRLGINYHFGAPPPPAPPMAAPPPPPPPPKVFIVFFDWDKDTITPDGMAIIQQAAAAYQSGAPVQIQVTGYTDRSGSAGYNQRLSERRANNVAKALAGLGVPRTQMAVSGRGENDNRVPTADGVREPQNRRVEIVAP